MTSYRTYSEVTPGGEILLDNIPFPAGKLVEIIVLDSLDESSNINLYFYNNMKRIQNLPTSKEITDEDIL